MALTAQKFESTYRGLSEQAKKVLNAVPMDEAWDFTQIGFEIKRNGQTIQDLNVLRGCLNSLVDAGMVIEPTKGKFIRVHVKSKDAIQEVRVTVKPEPKAPQKIEPQAVTKTGPIDILGNFAKRFREMADEMETAAIALAERDEKTSAEAEKLRQLQALLKSIG